MDRYIKTILKMPGYSNTIKLDIQGIAREKNQSHLLIFCEHVLGIAGNCHKNKEKYIDPILQLNEQQQAILMEIMLKYLPQEDSPKNHSLDKELLESLQTQLREKEIEKLAVIEHLKKVEKENEELAQKADMFDKQILDSHKENADLKKEIEELRRKSAGTEFIQREKELEGEISGYQQEIADLRLQWEEKIKNKNLEIQKLEDELYVIKQNEKKIGAMEITIESQKKEIEELVESNENLKTEMQKVSVAEDQLKMLQNHIKELEEKNIKLIQEYYDDKNKVLSMENDLKKSQENALKSEEKSKKNEEQLKFWEEKSHELEISLKKLQEDFDSYKLISGAGCLLSQEKESNYQNEISKLQKQLKNIVETSDQKIKIHVLELEAKIEVLNNEKTHQNQELILFKQKNDELEKENSELQKKIKSLLGETAEKVNLENNLERTKKDRDLLLDVSKRAQNALSENEQLKQEISKNQGEIIKLQSLYTKSESLKNEAEKKILDLNERILNLEKNIARNDEKIMKLNEEKEKNEILFKDQIKHLEIELNSKFSISQKENMDKIIGKYKPKIKNLKQQIKERDMNLSKISEEMKKNEGRLLEDIKKLKEEYEQKLKFVTEKLAQEKENARKAIREIGESSKREEQLISTAIYEISSMISTMIKEKHKGFSTTQAQKMLNKLEAVASLRNSIGSPIDIKEDQILKENYKLYKKI